MSPKIIFVEGNIGAGKTTFLKNIEDSGKNIQIIYEPVEEWRQSGMLDKFYKDPEGFGKIFQFYCLYTRFKLFELINRNVEYIFIERSMMCDNFVFARNCLCDEDYLEYTMLYNNFLKMYKNLYNYSYHFLYIYQPAWICHKHIFKRARPEENGISLEYLESLERFHNSWLRSISEDTYNNLSVWKDNNQIYMTANMKNTHIKDTANLILDCVLSTV